MNSNEITVTTYSLQTRGGRHIKYATRVTIDGRTVRFMDRMPKKHAIQQAQAHIARYPERDDN